MNASFPSPYAISGVPAVLELEKLIDWMPTTISCVAMEARLNKTSFGVSLDASYPPSVRLANVLSPPDTYQLDSFRPTTKALTIKGACCVAIGKTRDEVLGFKRLQKTRLRRVVEVGHPRGKTEISQVEILRCYTCDNLMV